MRQTIVLTAITIVLSFFVLPITANPTELEIGQTVSVCMSDGTIVDGMVGLIRNDTILIGAPDGMRTVLKNEIVCLKSHKEDITQFTKRAALVHMERKNYSQAITLISKIKEKVDLDSCSFIIAECFYRMKLYKAAFGAIASVDTSHKKNAPEFLFKKIKILKDFGMLNEAELIASDLLVLYPYSKFSDSCYLIPISCNPPISNFLNVKNLHLKQS